MKKLSQILSLLTHVSEQVRELHSRMDELSRKFDAMTDEMTARGEAADQMAEKANKLFEEGMMNLFSYNGE